MYCLAAKPVPFILYGLAQRKGCVTPGQPVQRPTIKSYKRARKLTGSATEGRSAIASTTSPLSRGTGEEVGSFRLDRRQSRLYADIIFKDARRARTKTTTSVAWTGIAGGTHYALGGQEHIIRMHIHAPSTPQGQV